jgi:hypothetical protein
MSRPGSPTRDGPQIFESEPKEKRMTTVRRPPTSAASPYDHDIDLDIRLATQEARALRWGPIWAGLLTAFGMFLLLTLLAIGLGIQRLSGEEADVVATLVGSVIGLVSLAAGGFIASWSAVVANPARGLLHGFLVWALWLTLVILLAAIGFGQVLGAFGSLITELEAPDVTQQQVIEAVQAGALQSFLALALTAAAGMLGGALGAMATPERHAVDADQA